MDSVGSGGDYDSVVGVYSEAKSEYSHQLSLFIQPVLVKFFFSLLDQARQEEQDAKKHIWVFQNKLSQIPEWNQDKVLRETGRIQSESGCDYLEDLLTAVFIAHTKVLSSIRLNNRQKKLQISIPKIDHFLHRTLSECSRQLWSAAYLFNDNIAAVEKQKNLEKINTIVGESILQAVRSMLPVKNILREYLSEEPDAPVVSQASQPAMPAPISEAQPIEEPVPAPAPISEAQPLEEPVPAPTPAQPLPPAEAEAPAPEQKNEFVVADTEPSVRFADFNTVFSDSGNSVEKLIDEDDGLLKFDESEAPVPLDDFEDLDAQEKQEDDQPIPIDDFEELPAL